MKKLGKLILAVLTLALVVSFAACKVPEEVKPGTATEAADSSTPAPTEEPAPADPLLGNWKMVPADYVPGTDVGETLELIFEKDNKLQIKAGGEIAPYTWTREDDTVTFNYPGSSQAFKILENTADKLVLAEINNGEYDEANKYIFILKQLPAGKLSKDDLLGNWELVDDNNPGTSFMQLMANGYGEFHNAGDCFDFFTWTFEHDELRINVKTRGYGAYFYVTLEGNVLYLDNTNSYVYEYTKNITGARAVNAITKDQLVGMWDDKDGKTNQFNADGTGIMAGSKFRWDLFGDVIELTFEEVYDGEKQEYSYYYITAISGNMLILDDEYDIYYYTRSN